MLDSALALRAKEGDIVRGKFINVSDMAKIKLKHANSTSFYHGKLKTRLSISNLC